MRLCAFLRFGFLTAFLATAQATAAPRARWPRFLAFFLAFFFARALTGLHVVALRATADGAVCVMIVVAPSAPAVPWAPVPPACPALPSEPALPSSPDPPC